jgi:uncharacterized Fe-S radical SAM superfamily protein PflX
LQNVDVTATNVPLNEQVRSLHIILEEARRLWSSDVPSVASSMTKVVAAVTQILRTVEPAAFTDRALPWE